MIKVRIGSFGQPAREFELADGSTVGVALAEAGYSSDANVKRNSVKVGSDTSLSDGDLLVVIGESKTSGAAPKSKKDKDLEAQVAMLTKIIEDAGLAWGAGAIEVPKPLFVRGDSVLGQEGIITDSNMTVLAYIQSQTKEEIVQITTEDGEPVSPFATVEPIQYVVHLKVEG